MIKQNKLITNNILNDNLLISFPLWFPLIYSLIIFNYPGSGTILFIFTLFIFAETHFASTWLFFFESENWIWIKENFFKILVIPLYTFILFIFIWFISPMTVIFFHYCASGWHVTKQSVGLMNLYGEKNNSIYSFIIYLSSFLFLFIGLNKPGILSDYFGSKQVNIFLFFMIILYCLVIFFDLKKLLNKRFKIYMPLLTGVLIYMPILFFDNLATATAVGVGMHWCQYITIVWSKFFRKELSLNGLNKRKLKKKSYIYIVFVLSYALFMTSLALIGIKIYPNQNISYNFFYLIPLIFQLFHFYIDGFIWKFSDPHIRKSVLPYMFNQKIE